MKKIVILGLCICASSIYGHSQSTTNQLPNGVVVHSAQGVEGTVSTGSTEHVKVRTIQDWTLAECIDALPFVMMKLNEASESDRERYLIEKTKIDQRIVELKSSN